MKPAAGPLATIARESSSSPPTCARCSSAACSRWRPPGKPLCTFKHVAAFLHMSENSEHLAAQHEPGAAAKKRQRQAPPRRVPLRPCGAVRHQHLLREGKRSPCSGWEPLPVGSGSGPPPFRAGRRSTVRDYRAGGRRFSTSANVARNTGRTARSFGRPADCFAWIRRESSRTRTRASPRSTSMVWSLTSS